MLQIRLPLPRFVSAGEIFSGSGSLGALRALDASKAMVLASGTVLAKHAALIERSIGAEVVRLVEMPKGEPKLATLKPVLAQVEAFRPDWIIAIGGGSVIDGAKLAWIFYEHPAVDRERLFLMGGLPTLRGKAKFVAVPTTAGTGSEVSSSALLIDEASGAKRAIVSHELLPDIAILDPRLALGCAPSVIANAGMDALAHAVESYASRLNNPLADALAEKAAGDILQLLPKFYQSPDNETLCLAMLNASLLAGWVQNQKVPGIGHAIAHQLGDFGVAHGAATGRLLVAALEFNCRDSAARAKYDTLAGKCGFANADALAAGIKQLVDELSLDTLPDKVYAKIPAIAKGAAEDPCAKFNPLEVNEDAVRAVLESAR